MIDLVKLKKDAEKQYPSNKKLVQKLKKKNLKDLDERFEELHEEAFEKIDCLDCANCCSSISPIVLDKDIDRISKALKMKPGKFIDQYLEMDQEQDYVFRSQPCPFLMPDKYCMIYEIRPKACRDYPHTNHAKMHKHLNLGLKNTSWCPAVFDIFEQLKKQFS